MGTPVDIIGSFYTSDTLPFAAQDCVNMLIESAEVNGTRTPKLLKPCPSNKALALAGFTGLGIVQASLSVAQNVYIVSNGKLWKITFTSPDNITFTANYQAITDDIFGREQVCMNYLAQGTTYLISIYTLNGGWVYDTQLNTITAIEGFQGSKTCQFIDQYMVGMTTNGDYWFTSDVDDPYTFIVFDTYTQESDPDKIMGIAVVRREVWVYGEKTIEVFVNSGTRFERQTVINRGCLNSNSIVVAQGIPFWLGDDGSIYMGNQYSPQRISTYTIESEISKCDVSKCFAYFWESNGHTVYCITFDDGYTFMYDIASQEWTRRETFGMRNCSTQNVVRIGNKLVSVNRFTSQVYELRWDNYADDDASSQLICKRATQYFHNNQKYGAITMAEPIMNTGNSPINQAATYVTLRYSDDDGRNWSSQRRINIGVTGGYNKRIRFYNMGRTMTRLFEISTSGKAHREILGMNLEVRE